MKSKFKMPSAFSILLMITVLFAILSWIVPAGKYIQISSANQQETAIVYLPLDRNLLFDIEGDQVSLRERRIAYAEQLQQNVLRRYPDLSQAIQNNLKPRLIDYLETGQTKIANTSQQIPVKQGLWNIVSAPIEGFLQAKDVALFVLIIGGYIGVLMRTQALQASVYKLIEKMKGKERYLIPILMIIFSIGGTTYGMCEETIAFYPIVIAVFLAAGYDIMTGFSVVLVSAGIGVLASTTNPFATGVASSILGLGLAEGLTLRFLMWITFLAIGICYVMRYAEKVKVNPERSITKGLKLPDQLIDMQETVTLNKRHKWVMVMFGITFGVLIIGVIPWSSKFNIQIFNYLYNKLASLTQILGWQSNLQASYRTNYELSLTHSAALGDWYFGQLSVWFLLMAIVIGLISGMKEKQLIGNFLEGVKNLVGVALIVGLSRGIKVVLESGGIDATILYVAQELLKNTSPVIFSGLAYIINLPLSLLIPSTSGLANASMPIVGELAGHVFANAGMMSDQGKVLAVTAYQSASGLVNLVSPTSGTVMGAIAVAGIHYGHLWRFMWKLLVVLFVGTIIWLGIGVYLPI